MTSTPSATAASIANTRSDVLQLARVSPGRNQQALYAATRALGAMPSTSPINVPKMDALALLPAAVVAVCVPCPSASRGEKNSPSSIGPDARAPSPNHRAPISLLLQFVSSNRSPATQAPFQFSGGSNATTPGSLLKRRHSHRPSNAVSAQVLRHSRGRSASRVSKSDRMLRCNAAIDHADYQAISVEIQSAAQSGVPIEKPQKIAAVRCCQWANLILPDIEDLGLRF